MIFLSKVTVSIFRAFLFKNSSGLSQASNVNFIYDQKDLGFNITLSSGKPVSARDLLKALIQMLRAHGLYAVEQNGYYIIHHIAPAQETSEYVQNDKITASNTPISIFPLNPEPREFLIHKLQYQQGGDVETALRKIAHDLQSQPNAPLQLLRAIQSLQWVKTTNTLLASSDEMTLAALKKLIQGLDVPLKQVFIEVLVIETDVRNSMEFGLEWAGGGKWDNRLGFGVGNTPPRSLFGKTVQGISPFSPPSGFDQIPLGGGLNLGVIGNIILHKGKSYLSLGSLVSALQLDGDSTIVLNQKIITQDNKNSKIFVGDNIPFAGSVVQTIGASQQTIANIEYRDIGVSLSITPTLGEEDVITLDIKQEITEAHDDIDTVIPITDVNGIRTTKTDMATQVHVPDRHFLILTGMVRNHKSHHKAGIPCLGGLPVIGAAFSKNKKRDDKKNVIVYVRPQIIHSIDDYKQITEREEGLFRPEPSKKEGTKGHE